ncbi:MAG: hypothetical protein MUD01_15520 [Chloroflexaceae bacterium]|nr:hypothetical protein [Chloroflexaceae bacterium]
MTRTSSPATAAREGAPLTESHPAWSQAKTTSEPLPQRHQASMEARAAPVIALTSDCRL